MASLNEQNISAQTRRFKARQFGAEGGESKEGSLSDETLVSKCIRVIAQNFHVRPSLKGVPEKLLPEITAQLSTDIPVTVSGPGINDEAYWKRCCLNHEGWRNCQISEHGLTWKQCFFEKYLQDALEDFDPATQDIEELRQEIIASEDYVFNLKIRQLLSHLDLQIMFRNLPNLTKLELTYGVKRIGMKFERSLFGMKISDATSLANCIRATDVLTTLLLPCNLIDDDLLRMLMTGLINNSTITHLDVSHNKITNHGARLLAKLLGSRSVLTSLNLCDNQIHAEGGRYLGRALKRNESLVELNLRLNRLTDEGGRMLFDGLRENITLSLLNLSSNSLAMETTKAFSQVIREGNSPLAALDMSCNDLAAEEATVIQEAIEAAGYPSLTSLDLRSNQVSKDADAYGALMEAVRRNELELRGFGHK